ncbi:oxidoreductase family protein [uncultured Shewanella sp.]|uniref:oxidoreductase family protein n=1 Tax=uncultured Shewanella sp. TaxID=173975 RepID=UPI00262CBB4F|nr:oxidoreductase family protein [uncultured Shewanella sp.]
MNIESILLKQFNATNVDKVAVIQPLWSGYGEISRYHLAYSSIVQQAQQPRSVIIKHIHPPLKSNHPRGWNTQASFQRKLMSYDVEAHWYTDWAHLCTNKTTIPRCYGVFTDNLEAGGEQKKIILLSDLDEQGFSLRHQHASLEQAKACLTWLAHFHGQFLQENPEDDWMKALWQTGTYWHLATRLEEFENMPSSLLKQAASKIDRLLNACRFQTLVHGDAKIANFCFANNNQVAAVDFQYIGAGCGMKDVAYFLGSCLTEDECDQHTQALLKHYFIELKKAVCDAHPQLDIEQLEREWRHLFVIAWADFQRFLLGWSINHPKNNGFSKKITQNALSLLSHYSSLFEDE